MFGGSNMISVIIPAYNAEKQITNCLKSFENQRYKDFEIIVVNDGSTDKSEEVVNNYKQKSPMNILLVTQINSGVSVARNTGVKHARGNYLCFVDSDDMVTPEYLEKLLEEIDKNEADVSFCDYMEVSEGVVNSDVFEEIVGIQVFAAEEALKKFLYRDISPGVWCFLIRKDFFVGNKLKFSEGYRYSEDIELIFKLLACSNKTVHIKGKFYLYRISNTSVMSLVDDKRRDGFELMKNLELYFKDSSSRFSKEYNKYGVARWVWATMWQVALASKKYVDFHEGVKYYMPKTNMKKLMSFPKYKIALTSMIYILSPKIYYKLIRIYKGRNDTVRLFKNG